MRKPSFIYFFLPLILILAACSPAASPTSDPGYLGIAGPVEEMSEGGGFAGEDGAAAPPAPGAAQDRDNTTVDAAGLPVVDRLVIKNGDLSIAVEDPEVKLSDVMSMAEDMGGFVVSSNLYFRTLESGAEVPQAEVTIRVPAERFDEAITRIKEGVGQVLGEYVTGEDVTQQYVDLQSRLTNLQAAETELQRIMEEAVRTEDVLNVYNQLIYIREQIEVIQGQINYFEQSAAFSAIRVSIIADAAVQPLTIGGWEPAGVAREAIQALIDTLKGIANALIWIALYLLPVVLVIVLPLRLLWGGFRRMQKRNAAKAGAPEAEG